MHAARAAVFDAVSYTHLDVYKRQLQDLAPEIGVDGDGFPAHRGRRRIGEPVKTIDQTDFFIPQRGDDVGQKIRRDAHVGVADEDQIVFRQPFELDKFGGLGVRAGEFSADDELRVAPWIFGDDFLNHFAGRIVRAGDAEKNLDWAGIILIEPASQRTGGGVVAALERLEQRDGRRES